MTIETTIQRFLANRKGDKIRNEYRLNVLKKRVRTHEKRLEHLSDEKIPALIEKHATRLKEILKDQHIFRSELQQDSYYTYYYYKKGDVHIEMYANTFIRSDGMVTLQCFRKIDHRRIFRISVGKQERVMNLVLQSLLTPRSPY